jgi:nucleoside-diphosphate-sugar epimerase
MHLKFESKSVAIIGCGWLGLQLAFTLLERGYRVIATCSTRDRVSELENQGIQTIRLVLTPDLECSSLLSLKGFGIAVVLLPPRARTGGGWIFPKKISNLISGLKTVGINRVVFTSSTSVYPSNNREVNEAETAMPDSETGRILVEAEKRVMSDPEIQSLVIRFAGLCGPGRDPGHLLAGRDNLRGGDTPVNLIHSSDAVELLINLIEKQPWGQVFNGCAPEHPLKRDLYPAAAERMGLAPPIFNRESDAFKKVKADKICRQLGFVYRYPDPRQWRW